MTVASETKSGTKAEAEGQNTPEDEAQTLDDGSKVSSEDEKPIYTQKHVDALIHAERSEWGRKLKEAEVERDGLKSKMLNYENELEDNKTEIQRLETQYDDLSSGDPKRLDVSKELKLAREDRRQLRAKLADVTGREQSLSEREKKVLSFETDVLIETVADDYENGDFAKLKKAISGFEKPTEEQIRTIADIFWNRKVGEATQVTKQKAPVVYSGKTSGGGTKTEAESLKARYPNSPQLFK